MILVVAFEPPAWLDAVAAREGVYAAQVRLVTAPALVRKAATAWARGGADRRFRAQFFLRRLADRRAARRVRSHDVVAVYASSLSATRCFAAAPGGASSVLVEDLPDLATLHDDLDAAARAHPESRLLCRYRADRATVAQQQAERALAHTLLVRSDLARRHRHTLGLAAAIEHLGPRPPIAERRTVAPAAPTILLAGLATARNGLGEALRIVEADEQATLLLQVGEGLEPQDALDHPRVRRSTPDESRDLTGVDLLVAPAWCEVVHPEVARAAAMGIPIIATDRAAGMVSLSRAGIEVEPGDVAALLDAMRTITTAWPG